MKEEVTVRFERKDDVAAIYMVNELAFEEADEAKLVDALREHGVPMISLVACLEGGELVGHCLFTPVIVEDGATVVGSMALGPVAVLPAHQSKGIGSQLIRAGLEACREAGHQAAFVLGHSTYYPRFGFQPSHQFNIRCEFDVSPEVFMAIELQPNALSTVRGIVKYHPKFREV